MRQEYSGHVGQVFLLLIVVVVVVSAVSVLTNVDKSKASVLLFTVRVSSQAKLCIQK